MLDEDPAPPKKGHSLLNFRPMSVVAKRSSISATADHLFYQGTGLSLGVETMSLDLGLCLGTESRSLGLEETSFDNMSEIFYDRDEILASHKGVTFAYNVNYSVLCCSLCSSESVPYINNAVTVTLC